MRGTALGLDLGLKTGWALLRRTQGSMKVLDWGLIDVRNAGRVGGRASGALAADAELLRMIAWAGQVMDLLMGVGGSAKCPAPGVLCYEQVRHQGKRAGGQGSRYTLLQEGWLLGAASAFTGMTVGVNNATLRAWARQHAQHSYSVTAKPLPVPIAERPKGWEYGVDGWSTPRGLPPIPLWTKHEGGEVHDARVAAWAAHWLMHNATEV